MSHQTLPAISKLHDYNNVKARALLEVPLQTFSMKLDNGKATKLVIRVRNDTKVALQKTPLVYSLAQAIAVPFIRQRRSVLDHFRDISQQYQETREPAGPSLLEEIMHSDVPVRNGSFMISNMIFSMVKSVEELNQNSEKQFRTQRRRATLSNQRYLSGLILLSQSIDSDRKRTVRGCLDQLKAHSKHKQQTLRCKIANRIARQGALCLESTLLRLFQASKVLANKSSHQQSDSVALQSSLPENTVIQQSVTRRLTPQQQYLRMECFMIIIRSLDKVNTFLTVSEAFVQLRTN